MRDLSAALVLATVIAGMLPACSRPDSPKVTAAELAVATTPEEEAALFERMVRTRSGLGFQPYDREGKVVDMARDAWWEQTHRLVITYQDERLDHVLVAKRNVLLLMRE